MKIDELMNRAVHTCSAEDSLSVPAGLMWEHDIGCVPVTDQGGKPVGIITDRDICVAAYFSGRGLPELPVSSAMSKVVHSLRLGQTVQSAGTLMRAQQVRRLPVVDPAGKLVGIISLDDLALAAGRARAFKPEELTTTLASICRPRSSARA